LSLKTRWRLGRELAARHYDAVYVLPNSLKSAIVPFMAGIPQRIGFVGESRYGLINRRHTLDKAALPLMVERFAQLAEAPGTPPARPIAPPRIQSSAAQQAATLRQLGLQRPARLVAFCPGAEFGPAKRWPSAHFAELARQLAADGCAIWLFGSPKDHAVAEEISHLAPGLCRNLCGTTRLDEAVDLLALADLVVCNDSGLMHVAAALDRPLVTLYGSSSPGFTPPLSAQADILSLQLSCSPCFKRHCPLGHLDCLTQLTPERVLAACRQRLIRPSTP
jgi:heptosyltransferase-2